jgi:monoamine oxidase
MDEVVILGAGFAGLSAASALAARGISTHIIEARDRVGGRTRTDHFDDGLWLDIGGQWLGPGQDDAYALAARLGREVWAAHTAGEAVLHLDGKAHRYTGLIPRGLPPLALANLSWAMARLDRMAAKVPISDPWNAPNAAKLDQRTVGDWLRRNVPHAKARLVLEVAFEAVFAAHPDDISLLHALFYLRSGGGINNLTASSGGAQQDRVDGGMQGLAEAWSDELRSGGVTFEFEAPVRAVTETAGGLQVHTDADRHTAARVISTLPPILTLDVDFHPAMPTDRRAWCEGMVPGAVIKCFAIYDRPFWRDAGLSGEAVGDLPPVQLAFDATPPDVDYGVLLTFIEGREARHWAEAGVAQRQQVVLAAFERFFGSQALAPTRYIDHVWPHEEWSRGCYAGVAGPGLVTSVGASARRPHGRVSWAGTETATEWNGYIEGAIRSGVRAAREVRDV